MVRSFVVASQGGCEDVDDLSNLMREVSDIGTDLEYIVV